MTNNTIPNVPRELLERAVRIPTKASVEENHAAIVDRGRAQSELRALLSAPSPAGVDGLEEVGYVSQDDIEWKGDCTLRLKPYSDYQIPLCRLSDAQAIIDGLRDQLHVAHEKIGRYADQRDQHAQRIGELAELASQANVNCKNTAYYLRKYRPDLADICSGWCVAIDAALSAGKDSVS